MRIRITLVAALVDVIVLTGALAPSPLARAADTDPIVPMGALAHAARALDQDANGKILEIRLTDEAGAPAFEAAIAKDDALVYMRIESVSDNVTEIKVRVFAGFCGPAARTQQLARCAGFGSESVRCAHRGSWPNTRADRAQGAHIDLIGRGYLQQGHFRGCLTGRPNLGGADLCHQ